MQTTSNAALRLATLSLVTALAALVASAAPPLVLACSPGLDTGESWEEATPLLTTPCSGSLGPGDVADWLFVPAYGPYWWVATVCQVSGSLPSVALHERTLKDPLAGFPPDPPEYVYRGPLSACGDEVGALAADRVEAPEAELFVEVRGDPGASGNYRLDLSTPEPA